jgi:hypothetical protein
MMPGNKGLGPLDENAATLGDSTPFPTTVKVREILTTGVLHATDITASLQAPPFRHLHVASHVQ